MKKTYSFLRDCKIPGLQTFLRTMKLTIFLLLLSVVSVFAGKTYSQTKVLNLNMKNSTVKEVLHNIEEQSEFYFMYSEKLINVNREVSVSVKNKKINEVLDELFAGTNVIYKVRDRFILLTTPEVTENDLVLQQQKSVSGKVTDSSGSPLPGVTVIIKGTTNGTITNADGEYSLTNVPANATLQFSFVGMKTQEIAVGGKSAINVVMEENTIGLGEVVAVGYGTMKKSDLTGSVSSVSADDFKTTPLRSLSSMLQGSTSGIEIIKNSGAPGSGSIVRIRGGNSMNGSNDPLYVVDGFPGGSVGNPNDIESIQILKDASATAIYGSRGANGVIIITTKRGKDKPDINLDVYYGMQKVRKKLDMLNGKEYAEFANEKAENVGLDPYFDDINDLPGETDWQDVIFQLAPISNYNLSVTGGNEMNKYGIFGNYSKQEGIILNSDYSSGNIRINLDNKVNRWFNIATSISASHSATNSAYIQSNVTSIVSRALVVAPCAPVYDENGDYYDVNSFPTADTTWDNPMAIIDGTTNKSVYNTFNGNTNLEFTILDGLTASMRLGANYTNYRRDYYLESIMLDGGEGTANIKESDTYNYLYENILSYKKVFNEKHDLNFTAGFTWEEETSSYFTAGASDFLSDDLLTDDLSSGSTVSTPTSYKSKSTILSWLGRVNYILDNKYMFTVTTRADGSSRLGANNKWGIFPSGAIGWRVSEEKFMDAVPVVSNLKLRTSYGVTGNQGIGLYKSLSRLSSVEAILGEDESRVIGYVPSEMQNPDLKWEVTKQFDAGFDLGLMDQKISLTFDYYYKKTSDLLSTVPLAISSGYTSILKNFGDMENKGFELGINSNLLNRDKWSCTIGANFSLNRNKVLKVATDTGYFFAGSLSSPVDTYVNIIKEGYPLSSFYGYLTDGLWESDQDESSIQPTAKAGDQRYVDYDKSGAIDDGDKVILGNPYPDFMYGFNSNISYKNFSLYILVQGVQGGLIFNGSKFSTGDSFARNGNQLAEVKDHWSADNPDPNAKYPRLSNVSTLVSDRFFEDASYLRFKTISLSYNIPAHNMKWLQGAMVFVSGENLFTITGYSGYDPEVSSTSSGSLLKGIDYGAYPSTKTITVGVKLNL